MKGQNFQFIINTLMNLYWLDHGKPHNSATSFTKSWIRNFYLLIKIKKIIEKRRKVLLISSSLLKLAQENNKQFFQNVFTRTHFITIYNFIIIHLRLYPE